MKVVFALYKYFPYGGLQKDMLAMVMECLSRGHDVSIFCRSWIGDYPWQGSPEPGSHIDLNVLPSKRWQFGNHTKNHAFARQFSRAIARIRPDVVVGFNKIPGIDVYYAADTCFKAKLYRERPWIYRLLPRYRSFIREETQIFARGGQTHIFAIAKPAIDEYRDFYDTEAARFTLLPPGISRDRINVSGEHLFKLHEELELTQDKLLVLMVGSGFRTKGLDRAIEALAALPQQLKVLTHLVVVGEDHAKAFLQQARGYGLEEQLHFLGGRKDVPQLLRSADVLIHPAYRENTGTVLLEAAVAGLPVITTDSCGYAHYINDNRLGLVLPTPFRQAALNAALETALTDTAQIKTWRENGRAFAQSADIYSLPKRAVDVIEQFVRNKKRA